LGKWTFCNGSGFEGEWKEGEFHGKGQSTFSNGSGYEGEFKDGKAHGQGKLVYHSNII
jgi:hypothetical protein